MVGEEDRVALGGRDQQLGEHRGSEKARDGEALGMVSARRARTHGRFLAGARPAPPASVLLYLGVVGWSFESPFPVT
jgi:hypothetical protein